MGEGGKGHENRANKRPQEFSQELTEHLEKALCHPLRAKMLAKVNERPYSPSELADLLGEDLNKVSYHMKVLVENSCAEEVSREIVRGAEKTTYRGITRMLIDDETWQRFSRTTRTGISVKAFGETVERGQQALEAGTFDLRTDRVLVNHKLSLDDEGWRDAVEILREAHERIEELEPAAIQRSPDGLDRSRFTVSLLAYQSPPGE